MSVTLSHATVVYIPSGCRTTFRDGTSIDGYPHDTPHYHVIAHRCGYDGATLAYCREHEFAHSFLAEALHDRPSPILWALAHGGDVGGPASVEEEAMCQVFQRWLRGNERPILGGVDWDGLKLRAQMLLD